MTCTVRLHRLAPLLCFTPYLEVHNFNICLPRFEESRDVKGKLIEISSLLLSVELTMFLLLFYYVDAEHTESKN